ncbi:MAG: NADH-quinone oxidoreductase subunit NuoF [candidate division NC10 bacterium]|jgi:NADH-quinone oxidoreductase subunit F|nr:NADH-quinone oxidoreductase subunit NuoF [candidate division NC10 bacterium]
MASGKINQACAEILKRYPQKRSALLPLLHLVQEERGYLSPEALEEVANLLEMRPTDVWEVASFYTMFHFRPMGRCHIEVCHNLSCSLLGAESLLDHVKERLQIREGETTPDGRFSLGRAECLAACDAAPMVQINGYHYGPLDRSQLEQLLVTIERGEFPKEYKYQATAAPPSNRERTSGEILHRNLRDSSYDGSIEAYLARGGYQAIAKVLREHRPPEIVEMVKRSGLRGRGGAGFPAGVKWGFIPQDRGVPKYILCNADEGEPGTFKDRQLLERDPHQVIEGIIISSFAIGGETSYIYLRGEFLEAATILDRALQEAYARSFLGKNILGTDFNLDVYVHRGAGAYICGEETALIESLEGKRGEPRIRPPFPAVKGLYQCPTAVNNVETLCNIPHIILRGPEWYASLGTAKSTGARVFSVSGHVRYPGNYEIPLSATLRELIFEHAGGMRDGRKIKAIIPGGTSAPVLTPEHLDVGLDFESLAAAGSMGGSGAVIVMDETTCMVRVGEVVNRFYHHESCGQCTQCREGTAWLHQILRRIEEGRGRVADLEILKDVCRNMKGQTICVLSDSAAMPTESYLRYFQEEFEAHIQQGRCPFRQ